MSVTQMHLHQSRLTQCKRGTQAESVGSVWFLPGPFMWGRKQHPSPASFIKSYVTEAILHCEYCSLAQTTARWYNFISCSETQCYEAMSQTNERLQLTLKQSVCRGCLHFPLVWKLQPCQVMHQWFQDTFLFSELYSSGVKCHICGVIKTYKNWFNHSRKNMYQEK